MQHPGVGSTTEKERELKTGKPKPVPSLVRGDCTDATVLVLITGPWLCETLTLREAGSGGGPMGILCTIFAALLCLKLFQNFKNRSYERFPVRNHTRFSNEDFHASGAARVYESTSLFNCEFYGI